jgi:predicted nucleotide-binding protein
MFTAVDKIAKLERLDKQIDEWNSEKDLPPIFRIGKDDLTVRSENFLQWQRKVTESVTRIFGEHSHYIDDFNEIEFTSFLDHLSTVTGTQPTRIWTGLAQAKTLLRAMINEINEAEIASLPKAAKTSKRAETIKGNVFIGHGRSPLWARLHLYLQNELGLGVVNFESESRTGDSVVSILTKMLAEANFAILILTADDETATGSMRARQNVIHEVGLFQSRLGFNRAILLKQEGVEDFTNVAGLQYIPFSDNKIEQSFMSCVEHLREKG